MGEIKSTAESFVPAAARCVITCAFVTDAGPARPSNEDSVRVVTPDDSALLNCKGVLAVVADGMGGHEGGEVASALAVDQVEAVYFRDEGGPQESLVRALREANHQILTRARGSERLRGMGTTCTAAAVVNGFAYSAHVGDSRIYLIRGASVYRMTEDHSATMELVNQGLLSLSEARTHEDRNVILRAVGTRDDLDISVWNSPFPLLPGDCLLLCSDGLHDTLNDEEIGEICSADWPPEWICHTLMALALQRNASDNITAAVLRVEHPEVRP